MYLHIITSIYIIFQAQSHQKNNEETEDDCNMTLNDISNTSETEPTQPTEQITISKSIKSNKKKKCLEKDSQELLGKALSVLSDNEDDNDVFGKFVTSELRALQADNLRKKAKRQIQRILLDIAEEDDANMSTTSFIPVPMSSFSSTSSNGGYTTVSTYNPDYSYIVTQAVTDIPNVTNTFNTDL